MRRFFIAVSFVLSVSFFLSVSFMSSAQKSGAPKEDVVVLDVSDETEPTDTMSEEDREKEKARIMQEEALQKNIDAIILNKDGDVDADKMPQAIKYLDKYIADKNPGTEGAHIRRFDFLFNSGQMEKALADADALIEISPGSGGYHLNRAQCLIALGRTPEAVEDLNKAVEGEQDPSVYEDAYLELGRLYMHEENEKFFEVMGKLAKINPQSVRMHILYGEAYTFGGEIDKAQAHFKTALELDPENADAYMMRGFMWAWQRKFDKALEDLNASIEYVPGNERPYFFRYRIDCAQGDYEKALADISLVIEINDSFSYFYFERAKLYYFFLSDKGTMLDDIEKALELDPGNYEFGVLLDYILKE